ncbi:MAG: hypothetical protein HYR94_03095 [Chloroflexi bacterium]|nr:hypothetical protein [Chloroflexota bacterium]
MVENKYNHEPVEEFVFEDWLRDGMKGMRDKIESSMTGASRRRFDASEFREHMRNARKEQLLAIRSLLDSAIDWIDKQDESAKQEA